MLDWVLIGFQILFLLVQVTFIIIGCIKQEINLPIVWGCSAVIIMLMFVVLITP